MAISRWGTRARAGVVAAAAAIGYLVTSQFGVLVRGVDPFTNLRTLHWNDQLSYMAIAANVRAGITYPYEPFTQTGISHYPMGYYSFVGLVSAVTGAPPYTVWNIVGIGVQMLAIAVLALTLSHLSSRWWLGLLAPLPFLAGTYSLFTSGNWFTQFESHSVIWGPYGTLYSKNGEAAGLMTLTILISACVWVWRSVTNTAARVAVTITTGALLGLVSSFQTYSFLIGIYVFVFGIAALGVVRSERKRLWGAVSLGLLVIVAVTGPAVSQTVGQLPTLVFGLLPAIPGLVLAAARTRWLILLGVAAAVATSLPQILFTISGIVARDPFLMYRVASNHQLGIAYPLILLCSAPVAVPLIAAIVVAVRRRHAEVAAIGTATFVVWAFLALNDLWGANAEPYRFWNNGFLVAAVVASVCWAILLAPEPELPRRVQHTARSRAQGWALPTALLLVFLLSVPDWVLYSMTAKAQETWSPMIQRDGVIATLAQRTTTDGGGLVLAGPCVDRRIIKVTSGAPTAWYNVGLAWPADKAAIDALPNPAKTANILSADSLQAAHVKWVITDSHCPFEPGPGTALLDRVAEEPYVLRPADVVAEALPPISEGETLSGTVILWRVRG